MAFATSSPSPPAALWLNVSPSFQRLDRRLLKCLVRYSTVQHWAYRQTPDESSSLDVALDLLHGHIRGSDRPLHLIGHSTGGLVGLLYARRFPERVQSLTLLSVGVNPAVDWQAYYYAQLELLHCPRRCTLAQMVYMLLGHQPHSALQGWVHALEQDLIYAPSPHSLLERVSIAPSSVPVPLLVCGGSEDGIVDSVQLRGWQSWLKPEDRIWECPGGQHFFHASHPQLVASQILDFWGVSVPQQCRLAS